MPDAAALPATPTPHAAATVFAGASEMAARCRALDWGATPLGPVDGWPESLRTAAGMVMASAFATILCWGPDLVQVYNDGYVPITGAKHPWALGRPTREVWHLNGPLFARAQAGETVHVVEAPYALRRRGPDQPADDTFFTLSFSPVRDGTGAVAGVVVTAFEVTDQVGGRAAQAERERLLAALALERARLAAVFRQSPSFLAVLRGPDNVFELVNDAYEQLIGRGRDVVGKPLFAAIPEVRGQGFDALLGQVRATGAPLVFRDLPVLLDRTPGAPREERFLDITYLPLAEADGPDGTPEATHDAVIAHGTDVTEQVRARRDAEGAQVQLQDQQAELELANQQLQENAVELEAQTEELQATAAHLEAQAAAADAERLQTLALQGVTAALAEARTLEDVADVVVGAMAAAAGARAGSLAVPVPEADALRQVRVFGFPEAVRPAIHVQPLAMASPIPECFRTGAPIWATRRDGPDGMDARYPAAAAAWTAAGIGSGAYLPLVVAGRVAGVIAYAFAAPRAFAEPARAFLLALSRQVALAVERARLGDEERAARAEAEAARTAAETTRAAAEEANAAKSQFLANMSHELRTPLNAIGGYTQLLELGLHGPVTDDQQAALGRVQAAQRRLLALINDVLNYAKLEGGRVEYDLGAVDVRDVVADVAPLVEPQLAAKGLAFAVRLPEGPCVVWADRAKLGQVLVNLLSNAAKFTAGGGVTVDVATRPGAAVAGGAFAGDPAVFLRVADTGRGIPLDKQAAVFDPFVQVQTGYARTQEGTGLGLAISRDLARGMGGDLRVRSAEGEGSVFTVVLRRAAAAGGAPLDRRSREERRAEADRRDGEDRRHNEPGAPDADDGAGPAPSAPA